MWINLNPQYDEYGVNCDTCFDPSTAKYVYASVSSVKQGNNWAPGDAPPPNNIFRLEQWAVPCQWKYVSANWSIILVITPVTTSFRIWYVPDFLPLIFDGGGIECVWYLTSTHINPIGTKYYEGDVQISWKEPIPGPGIANVMEEMTIPRDDRAVALMFPIEDGTFVTRIVNKRYNTNVLIKYEY